jgi:hypothetical protein
MPRFLIEVPHPEEELACAQAIKILLSTGSHYLLRADWGCMDGDHRSWMIVDVENKEEARRILPPAFRVQSRITQLNKFTMEEIDEIISHHEKSK